MTVIAALLVFNGPARGADAGGQWKAEFESPIGQLKYVYDLKADGEKLTGKAIRELDGTKSETEIKEGKVSGDQVSFVELIRFDDQEVRIEYKGKLSGNEIKFTRQVGDFATMEIVAKRANSSETPAAGASKKVTLKVIKANSEETSGERGDATNAVDGDTATFWHTQWESESPRPPHEIIIELIPAARLKGFTYLPRQDESDHGHILDYEFYVSDDGKDFGKPVKKGTFADATSKGKKSVTIEERAARFIKLRALTEVNDEAWTSAAEIGVIVD